MTPDQTRSLQLGNLDQRLSLQVGNTAIDGGRLRTGFRTYDVKQRKYGMLSKLNCYVGESYLLGTFGPWCRATLDVF